MYESDHTLFIRNLVKQSPDLPQKQREGRSIWWDKAINADLYADFAKARIAQTPYVYQNLPQREDLVEVQTNSAEGEK